MLIEIYKLTYPGIKKVNEYYKWQLEWPETHKMGDTIPCPGCGKQLSYIASQGQHQCPGTFTDHPVTPVRHYLHGNTNKENAAKLNDYVAKSPHPVQISD